MYVVKYDAHFAGIRVSLCALILVFRLTELDRGIQLGLPSLDRHQNMFCRLDLLKECMFELGGSLGNQKEAQRSVYYG
jgi:hypothetical protein